MCSCPENRKKKYPAEIKLFTAATDGLPHGAAYVFPLREVIVCADCGEAKFSVPESSRYWFDLRHQ